MAAPEMSTTQETAAMMPTPAMQGEAASMDSKGIPLFISPQRDFVAKPGSDQDSWFWVANLETSRGTMNVLVHFLSVAATTEKGFMGVMVSLLDAKAKTYVSEEQDFPIGLCSLATDKFEVISPIAKASGDSTSSHVAGEWKQAGVALDLKFTKTGPLLANVGNGQFPMLGDICFHFAFPTMTAKGTITINGEKLEAQGPAWLDRQWGMTPRFFTPTPKRWIWFGIMLDNGDRISAWDTMENGREHVFATVVHPDGGHEVVDMEPTLTTATNPWTSPKTGNKYPTNWDVRIPQLDARLTLVVDVPEQEFVSPIGAHKYEASSKVVGTMRGKSVTGTVMIELVGDWK
jgi:predicted secreted hydrolase